MASQIYHRNLHKYTGLAQRVAGKPFTLVSLVLLPFSNCKGLLVRSADSMMLTLQSSWPKHWRLRLQGMSRSVSLIEEESGCSESLSGAILRQLDVSSVQPNRVCCNAVLAALSRAKPPQWPLVIFSPATGCGYLVAFFPVNGNAILLRLADWICGFKLHNLVKNMPKKISKLQRTFRTMSHAHPPLGDA